MTDIPRPAAAREPGTLPVLAHYGDWAELRLNRPDVHNRLELADIEVLSKDIEKLNADTEVRVVVLTGAGSRTFCSGFHSAHFSQRLRTPTMRLRRWSTPLNRCAR